MTKQTRRKENSCTALETMKRILKILIDNFNNEKPQLNDQL
jgi:hypothetical protein